jgi:DNA-3-methyladenine glycosylase II
MKIGYLKDLARNVEDGTVKIKLLPKMSDEDVIAHLTHVKGIGRWTAEMFLIFSLGRLDVLPVHDLGLRKGVQIAFSLPELPKPNQVEELGERWKPYRSIATWYLWKSLQKFDKIG